MSMALNGLCPSLVSAGAELLKRIYEESLEKQEGNMAMNM